MSFCDLPQKLQKQFTNVSLRGGARGELRVEFRGEILYSSHIKCIRNEIKNITGKSHLEQPLPTLKSFPCAPGCGYLWGILTFLLR